MKYYIVFVGGMEVYEDIDRKMAEWVAEGYIEDGYDDVTIQDIKEEE
tara:strand:+ start:2836 stop:2976 length:141 start_codon:yes stop_codon:yes gene_type:complete